MNSPADNNTSLSEARERLALLSDSLPIGVDPLSMRTLGGKVTRSKSPTVALCYREAQAWRFEELARAAVDLFEKKDLVAAIACTRHAAECCAGVWYLLDQMEKSVRSGHDPEDLHEQMVKLVVGSKTDANMPEAINVLTFIQKLDKKIPGYLKSYEKMSEVAHPNWAGSAAIFSKREESTLITYFGRGLRDTAYIAKLGIHNLVGSLELFAFAYNKITDLMPAFCDVCEAQIVKREVTDPPA